MNDLRLNTRFNLILVLTFILLLAANLVDDYIRQQSLVIRDAIDTSSLMARQLVETRAYLSSVLKNEVRSNENLIPQVASTRIALRISEGTRYTLRQVSLRYRNPQNMPDQYETLQLKEFAAGPATVRHRVVKAEGGKVFRYMLPMIAEASCLECHGTYEQAPDYIQKRFPKGHYSYNYKVGEVIGAVSVSIPIAALYKTIAVNLSKDLFVIGCIAILIILLVRWLMRRFIIDPISRLSATIKMVSATGNFSEKIPVSGKDEISDLIASYNAMMEELERKSIQQKESEERYRKVIEMARSAFVTFLEDGKIVIANNSAEKLLGLPREDLIGTSFFSFVVQDYELRQEIANSLKINHSWTGSIFSTRIIDIKGREREVEIALSATESQGRHIFTAIIRDQ